MIELPHYNGRKVGILGLGRSGMSTARALVGSGAQIVLWDDNERSRQYAKEQGYEIADLTQRRHVLDLEHLIISPGIPHIYPAPHPAVRLALENSVPLDNDVGLFFEVAEQLGLQVAAVTGTNGKSTATSLCAHLANNAGSNAVAAGNIGVPVLDIEGLKTGDIVVLELSSYQIELARTLRPQLAAFINFSPDHFDRHGGEGGYFAAKRRLFFSSSLRSAIVGIDDDKGRFLSNSIIGRSDCSLISVAALGQKSTRGHSFCWSEGAVIEKHNGRQIAEYDLSKISSLRGRHNGQNAAVALALCRELKLPDDKHASSLASFPGLPHRMQIVSEHRGVLYVNDSKATSASAAAQSLASFERIHWIVGGRAKEGGITSLSHLFPRLAKAYLIGEAATEFAETLAETPHEISQNLANAVSTACACAKSGETVLLAPACASFDQFESFEERGEAFCRYIDNYVNKSRSL